MNLIKINIIAPLFFFCIVTSCIGKGDIFVGIRYGGHYSDAFISNIYSPIALDKSPLLGYHIALSGKFFVESITRLLPGLQIDINYTQKGYQQYFTESSFKTQMFYLEIPFMASLVFQIRKNKEQVFINAGPYIEFFLFQNNTITGKTNRSR